MEGPTRLVYVRLSKTIKYPSMKTLKITLFSLALCMGTSFSAQAQIIDSLPWFKAPGKFMTPKVLDINATYSLVGQRAAIKSNRNLRVAGKIIPLPKTIRELKSPLILKRGDQCLEVYCAQTKDCSSCSMLWTDLNGDRKIQPRRELRCVCKTGGDNCGIKARRTQCK